MGSPTQQGSSWLDPGNVILHFSLHKTFALKFVTFPPGLLTEGLSAAISHQVCTTRDSFKGGKMQVNLTGTW